MASMFRPTRGSWASLPRMFRAGGSHFVALGTTDIEIVSEHGSLFLVASPAVPLLGGFVLFSV